MGVLGLASGLGSFLVALESIIGCRRIWALNKEIDDLSRRLHQLESAENRRLLLEMKQGRAQSGRGERRPPAGARNLFPKNALSAESRRGIPQWSIQSAEGLAAQLLGRLRLLRRLYSVSRLGRLDHVAHYGNDGSVRLSGATT
jgi:hypothetical protein